MNRLILHPLLLFAALLVPRAAPGRAAAPPPPAPEDAQDAPDVPVLRGEPLRIELTLQQGQPQVSILELKNVGAGVLSWEITRLPPWILVDEGEGRLTGGQTANVPLRIDPGDLDPGEYRGRIRVAAPGARDAPLDVEVHLSVIPPMGAVLTGPSTPFVLEQDEHAWQFTARGGYRLPSFGEEADLDGGPLVGVQFLWRTEGRMSWAAGLDLTRVKAEDGRFTSNLLALRGDVLVDLSAQEAVHRVYVLAGPALLLESVDDDPTNDSYTNSSPALNAGVGLALGNLPLDLRGEFTLPLDSENSDGWGVLSLGYRF